MGTVRAETVALRTRLIDTLERAGGPLSTPELCNRAGFNNFEHHAYVLPQLRALARVGVLTRIPGEPGGALSWRLNDADQDDAVLDAHLGAASSRKDVHDKPIRRRSRRR